MNTNKLEKLVKLSRELIHKPSGPNKHFSFILFKNEIISIGFNSYTKTHTKAVQYGYTYGFPHSELDAILKAPMDIGQMVRCRLVNIRLDKNGVVKLSKPCPTCSNLITKINFREVVYSTINGFKNLDLGILYETKM